MVDEKENKKQGFATRSIHVGQDPDPVTGAVTIPITLSTTFAQKSPGVFNKYEYSRTGNPTREALEKCLASLENGTKGLCFSSGSAGIATIINSLESGDHVISIDDVYGGTQRYFRRVAASSNKMTFDFIDLSKEGELEKTIVKGKTKLLWIETPTNPTLKIVDIAKLSKIAHKHGVTVVVDNTFATPVFQKPLDLGADVVLHSITKYINGHSDVVMGCIVTKNDELYKKYQFLQNGIGAIPSPFDCFMVLRGLKTLELRMKKHEENATKVAKFLEEHKNVDKVFYPGLESHPQHEIAKKQMTGYGGMVTCHLKGDIKNSRQFLENLKVFACAESLGAVESLAEHPALMTHGSVPLEARKKLGISDSLVRLSVGIEAAEDIIHDLKTALNAMKL